MSDQEATTPAEIAPAVAVDVAAPVVIDEPVRKPRAQKAAKAVPAPELKPAPEPASVAKPARKPVSPKPAAGKATPAKPAPVRITKQPVAANPGKTISETFPMTTDFTESFKTVFADAQGKAKAAYEKGTASLADAGEFAKGNAEAVVESGKILAEGLRTLSTGFVTETKAVFENLTAEVKELTAAKSPADFFKLQSELAKKYFDSSIAFGSKHSEAMMKLTTDTVAPLSRRASLAMEKIKAA